MHLATAIALALLKGALIVLALMGLLLIGSLLVSEGGDEVRQRLATPERLAELEDQRRGQTAALAQTEAQAVAQRARRQTLEIRLRREQTAWQRQLDDDLAALDAATQAQVARMEESLARGQRSLQESIRRREAKYCQSWNPLHWMTCRALRDRTSSVRDSMGTQQLVVAQRARQFERQAADQARRHRAAAEERLHAQTAPLRDDIEATWAGVADLQRQGQQLEEELARLGAEEARLRAENWLWIEFRQRWPYLLALALLIVLAPYLRRTCWYFLGMPLVARASPIELCPPTAAPSPEATVEVRAADSARTLEVDVEAGQRLLARTGYIQSDRQGATSALFFDRHAPNLSYLTGLVLLTRLESPADPGGDDEPRRPRQVLLGTPDDPEAYLMRVDLTNHPGLVLRASHVVAVIGDVTVDSTWRLTNLHAWATSQVRFITFAGTGSLILEGFGDIQARLLEDQLERKRMTLVVGFDTRLTYKTERSATFLPYLIDPGREPLVVDVFEGTGAVFFEKNPSARKRYRSTGEAIAGFFLDVIRKLLGL